MLTQDVVQGIRNLLLRADIKGQEVPAFNRIMTQLAAEEQEIVRLQQEAQMAGRLPGPGVSLPPVEPPPANGAVDAH